MPARADNGYSAVADRLRLLFPEWTGDRRYVANWAARGSLNGYGQPFPAGPPFDLDAVAEWFAGGYNGPGNPRSANQPRDEAGHFARGAP